METACSNSEQSNIVRLSDSFATTLTTHGARIERLNRLAKWFKVIAGTLFLASVVLCFVKHYPLGLVALALLIAEVTLFAALYPVYVSREKCQNQIREFFDEKTEVTIPDYWQFEVINYDFGEREHDIAIIRKENHIINYLFDPAGNVKQIIAALTAAGFTRTWTTCH